MSEKTAKYGQFVFTLRGLLCQCCSHVITQSIHERYNHAKHNNANEKESTDRYGIALQLYHDRARRTGE